MYFERMPVNSSTDITITCVLPPAPNLGSVTLFAVMTVILGCLKTGYFVGFSECLSATEGVFPVTHTVHTLVQVNHAVFIYVARVSQGVRSGMRAGVRGEPESVISESLPFSCRPGRWGPVSRGHLSGDPVRQNL